MTNSLNIIIIFLFLFINNINAQEIKSDVFKYIIINENFDSKDHDFPIIRENDNYFILDEDEYLTIRENNSSEYAIIIENSLTENSYLKTKFRLGPSENNNASIGIIASANKKFSKALVVEVNRKGEYRIKQLNTNTYIYLSGKKRKNGWVRNKYIKKENEYNILELIDNKNNITLKINNNLIQTFHLKINNEGYSGLLIGPYTKSRVSYYYLNSDKAQLENKKVIEKNIINNNNQENNNSEEVKKINNLQAEIEILTNNLKSKTEEKQQQLESKEIELKNSEYEIQKFKNLISKTENNDEIINSKIEILKKKLDERTQKLSTLKDNNNILLEKNLDLNKEVVKYKNDYLSLNNKLLKVKDINIKKTDVSLNDQKEIKELTSKIDRSNSIMENIKTDLKNINILNNKLKEKLIDSTNLHEQKNKLLKSQITNLKIKNDKLNLIIRKNSIDLLKVKDENIKNKENISQLSLIIDLKNIEISKQIKTNNYLKEIFVYKDFELNGVTPSTLIIKEEKPSITIEITSIDSSYTIQMGVFTNPINNFKLLDKIWVEKSNEIYTFYYGEFKKANDAVEMLNRLRQLGYKNIHIIKKKNKNHVTKK